MSVFFVCLWVQWRTGERAALALSEQYRANADQAYINKIKQRLYHHALIIAFNSVSLGNLVSQIYHDVLKKERYTNEILIRQRHYPSYNTEHSIDRVMSCATWSIGWLTRTKPRRKLLCSQTTRLCKSARVKSSLTAIHKSIITLTPKSEMTECIDKWDFNINYKLKWCTVKLVEVQIRDAKTSYSVTLSLLPLK